MDGSGLSSKPQNGVNTRTGGRHTLERNFEKIAGKQYDLAVIGGGIIGSGIARDAALRGLKTLLIDKEDYSYGTTSTSSRLIHGGLRYLRQLEFGLVRQDMREREILLRIAPHLVHPLPFLMPITSLQDRFIMACGMRLYDIISFDKTLPSYRYYSRQETMALEPKLETKNLRGAFLFYDCQIPFAERLCVENVLSAQEKGADTVNHARLSEVIRESDTVTGIVVEDVLTGKSFNVATRMVVNAAGPWMDIVHHMLSTNSKPMMRRTKGIHLLTPKVSSNALVLFSNTDGRLFFVIPWEGYSIIGTTDTDYNEDSDTVAANKDDTDYLLREVRRSFPSLKEEDVYYTFAGLRALAGKSDGSASNVSRGHRLIDHEKTDGLKGFISVIGGKITGFRAIAEEITDLACRKLGVDAECTTAVQPLPGSPALTAEELEQAIKDSGLPHETIAHLNNMYGSRMNEVLDLADKDERGKHPVCAHSRDIIAQIWHAVQNEQAMTPGDFLLRRGFTGMASCLGLDAVETVVKEMGRMLNWNQKEQARYLKEYSSYTNLHLQFRS
jgi:glycerol-3-phosphate dehydrogenase